MWIFFRKPNPCCPYDSKSLTPSDLFPDNYTSREIRNIKRPCPNAALGCTDTLSPISIEQHLERACRYSTRHLSSQHSVTKCQFAEHGCTFQAINNSQLDTHIQQNTCQHLNVSIRYICTSCGLFNVISEQYYVCPQFISDAPTRIHPDKIFRF